MKKKILIFIITYYASFRLRTVFNNIPLKKLKNYKIKILISEDSSKDDTWKIAKSIYKKNKTLLVLNKNKNNLNYGGNIKKCLSFAEKKKYDYAIMLHGDAQYHPKYINKLIDTIESKNCAAVCGSRMHKTTNALNGGMPFYKYLGNIFLTKLFNFIYNQNFTDAHSGYWIYNLKIINKKMINNLTNTFNFDNQLRIALVKKKFLIEEIPIQAIYGTEKSSIHLKYAIKFFFETIFRKFV